MKKKQAEMKIVYRYVEPKTEEEKANQENSVNKAFDILFEETEKRMRHNGKAPK